MSEFRVAPLRGQQAIELEIPEGTLRIRLPDGTSVERAGEFADYLNLLIEGVTLNQSRKVEPAMGEVELDVERLNAEQPVSEAVVHA